MKRILMIAIVISLCAAGGAFAGRRRTAAMPAQDELTIEFVPLAAPLDGDVLDLGVIAHAGRDPRRTVVRQTVGVRVTQRPATGGSVALRASLQSDDPRFVVRIDGRTVGMAPVVIEPRVPLGVVRTVRIEIEVPASVPEGPLLSGIRWEATTN